MKPSKSSHDSDGLIEHRARRYSKVKSSEIVKFEHIIIDAEGPRNPHIKAVGDVNGDGIAENAL